MTTYSVATALVTPTLSGASTTRTFSLTPKKVGNLGFLAIAWQASTLTISSIASSNASWGTVQAKTVAAVTSSWAFQWFAYVPTSTSAQTVTVTFSGTPTAVQPDIIEMTGDWVGKNPATWFFATATPKVTTVSSTAITWPSLTGFSNDELFLGYIFPSAAAFAGTNGTPAGFTYGTDAAQGNGMAWDLNYGVGPIIPQGTQGTAGVYLAFSAVFSLESLWLPSTIGGTV